MDRTEEARALKPCLFCGAPLFIRDSVNAYGRCDTEGCWMHERKITVPLDVPKQVDAWNARAQEARPTPIDMLLYCPKCGLQHVDKAEQPPRLPNGDVAHGCEICDGDDECTCPGWKPRWWTNPPHRSHLCHGCGCIWRPADVATNGVLSITTTGKADTWTPTPVISRPTLDAEAMRGACIAACAWVRSRAVDHCTNAYERGRFDAANDIAARLNAPLPAALSTGEWQPIETAPQNYTPIWLGCVGNMRVGWWADGAQHENFGTVGGGWIDMARTEAGGPRGLTFAPTHWARTPQAILAPPAPGGEE